MDKIAVLIPCFNESLTIGSVIRQFKQEIPDAVIYVYDNNSTDESVSIARSEGAIVRYEYSQGKGNVIRRMFSEIIAKYYVLVDADDTYPADSIKALIDKIEKRSADMVVGDRLSSTYFVENKRAFHNIGNVGIRWLVNNSNFP